MVDFEVARESRNAEEENEVMVEDRYSCHEGWKRLNRIVRNFDQDMVMRKARNRVVEKDLLNTPQSS